MLMYLDNLYFKASEGTPEIDFKKGSLTIKGNSFPEDAVRFWTPMINWIDSYTESDLVSEANQETVLNCMVSYFNTGSRPFILTIVKQLNEMAREGHKVTVNWYYEDDLDEIMDDGDLNFDELIDNFILKVNFIGVKKL